MPLGSSLRTSNTMMEVQGAKLCVRRFCQSLGIKPPWLTKASTSPASASVTTSASMPSMTELACLPEPPCDCLMLTSWPALAFQYLANAAL